MVSATDIVKRLEGKARPDQLEGMARFGISTDNRLGVSIPELRKLAKELRKNHDLALDLWKTKISDAMILASMIDDPEKLTEQQMEDWVRSFDSWDVCDQVCMNLFDKHALAWKKIVEWSKRDEEFVKRAAFSLIACLSVHDKEAEDQKFLAFLPIIKRESVDNRNYVKKAVNWALRNIGKRNSNLNKATIECSIELKQMDFKASRWIGSNALRELESEAVQRKTHILFLEKVGLQMIYR